MRKEIPFRMLDGSTNWLQPGSRAHLLHTEGRAKELIEHMKDVQRRHDALVRPTALEILNSQQKGGFKYGEMVVFSAGRTGKSLLGEEMARQATENARG